MANGVTYGINPGPAMRQGHDARKKFTSPQRFTRPIHEEVAIQGQREQGRSRQGSVRGRGGQQGGARAREQALRGGGNRYGGSSGFGVGVESPLDASPAGPYWRNLER